MIKSKVGAEYMDGMQAIVQCICMRMNVSMMERTHKRALDMTYHDSIYALARHSYSRATKPLASTLEKAVVGVGGTLRPINDRVRPSARKLDIRGVLIEGKGTRP